MKRVKKQNRLTDDNIDKIISAYRERKDVDKFAHVADLDEIKENEFNLNIPRYVDTFEEEPPIDISAVEQELADLDKQIAVAEKEFNEMKSQLVETNQDEK